MKIAIFALGSGIAGLAGALYAHYFRFITPEQFEILQSSAILTMVVVGGMRTTWGPVIGALLLQALPQAISFLDLPPSILGPIQGLLFTGLVLVFMFFRPQGLVPAKDIWRARIGQAGGAALMAGVLEIKNMSKSFDGIVVADDVDLTLEAGRVVGLIGPNGAGKTSLFNLVCGVVKPDGGTVSLNGASARWAEIPSARPRRPWPDMAAHAAVSIAAGDRQPADRNAPTIREKACSTFCSEPLD